MDISTLFEQWKQFVGRMNTYGIPLPTLRDPKTGLGSISFTLLVISFVTAIVGLIGKWSGKLGGIDVSNALELFYGCSALYFGRNIGFKSGTKIATPIEKPLESDPK